MTAKTKTPKQSSHDLTLLPFVSEVLGKGGKTETSYWCVPPTKDYSYACRVGHGYVISFLRFIKNDPFWVGSAFMLSIMRDMAKVPSQTAENGYAVGFLSEIESSLHYAAECANFDVMEKRLVRKRAA